MDEAALLAEGLDVDHLLAEHRAAVAEIERLRRELDAMEGERDNALAEVDELHRKLEEIDHA